MISRNKKFGFRQTLIGAGALLIVGTIGLTTYADGSVDTEVETKVNNEVVESIKQNNENEDKVEAVITVDGKTTEVFDIKNCEDNEYEDNFKDREENIEDTDCDEEIKTKGRMSTKIIENGKDKKNLKYKNWDEIEATVRITDKEDGFVEVKEVVENGEMAKYVRTNKY